MCPNPSVGPGAKFVYKAGKITLPPLDVHNSKLLLFSIAFTV